MLVALVLNNWASPWDKVAGSAPSVTEGSSQDATNYPDPAIKHQQAAARHSAENPSQRIELRIGLHTGETVESDGDVFGQNVILAVRIADAWLFSSMCAWKLSYIVRKLGWFTCSTSLRASASRRIS